jgi:hypothetical protein
MFILHFFVAPCSTFQILNPLLYFYHVIGNQSENKFRITCFVAHPCPMLNDLYQEILGTLKKEINGNNFSVCLLYPSNY